MSLQSWKKEFYKVEADKADHDPLVAALHSLQKWIGLRPENLAKHGVVKDGRELDDGSDKTFIVDDESCSLCQYSYNSIHGIGVGDCFTNCPLGHYLDPRKGDMLDEDSIGCEDEYVMFIANGDAEPMIAVLEETVKMLQNKKNKIDFPKE